MRLMTSSFSKPIGPSVLARNTSAIPPVASLRSSWYFPSLILDRSAITPSGERMATVHAEVEVEGRKVRISNPDKVFFSTRGETKLDLVRYYLSVGPGDLRGVRDRPTVLKRYPNGAPGECFYHKRVPSPLPESLGNSTWTF